jgi:hypothetical protein
MTADIAIFLFFCTLFASMVITAGIAMVRTVHPRPFARVEVVQIGNLWMGRHLWMMTRSEYVHVGSKWIDNRTGKEAHHDLGVRFDGLVLTTKALEAMSAEVLADPDDESEEPRVRVRVESIPAAIPNPPIRRSLYERARVAMYGTADEPLDPCDPETVRAIEKARRR